jgi:hypothetical protein
MTKRVGQSTCPVCGRLERPGAGIVLHFGAGGRVHRERHALAQKPVPTNDHVQGGTRVPPSVTTKNAAESEAN